MQIQTETAHLATDAPLNTTQKTNAENISAPNGFKPCEPSWIVYPGDWVAHYPHGSKPAPGGFPADPKCGVCGEPGLFNDPCIPDTHSWFNILTKAVRCQSCQEICWQSDGYEIDELGMPSCWNREHTREERIAERERNQLQMAAKYRARNGEGEYRVLYQSLLAREPEGMRHVIEQLTKKERQKHKTRNGSLEDPRTPEQTNAERQEPQKQPEPRQEQTIRQLSSVEMMPIKFIDKPLFQANAFHLVVGKKNAGKGTFLSHLAARFTRGELGEARNVIWIAAGEDSLSLDVRPRIEGRWR